MNIEQIARVAHETNRAFCQSIGDNSQRPWNYADGWQKRSAIDGVKFAIDNPGASASAQHDSWMAEKLAAGWAHGPVKDADKKTHPCLVPYGQLPLEQQMKDHLFRAVVKAFVDAEAGA